MSHPIQRLPIFLLDALLAVSSVAFLIWGTTGAMAEQPDARSLGFVGYGLLVLASLALLVMHRQPETALLVSAAANVVYFVAQYPYGPAAMPTLIALYFCVARGRRLLGWAVAAGLVLLPLAALAIYARKFDPTIAFLLWLALVAMVMLAGEISRSRHAYATAMRHRADEAERTREQEAERRANDERLRIARDLHDVTGHTVSVIALQAAAASEAAERNPECPEEIRTALRTIRAASRQTMAEIRASIGVLRAGEGNSLAPMLGRAQLGTLVENATSAGVATSLEVSGTERALPPAVDVTMYRVVQESLTNVLRHSAAARADVRLSYRDDGVRLSVSDDGRGAAEGAVGHGVTGMKERVAAIEGDLRAGPCAGGGFEVTAWLPTGAEAVT